MATGISADIRVGLIISVFQLSNENIDLVENELKARPNGYLLPVLNDAYMRQAYIALTELTQHPEDAKDEAEIEYFMNVAGLFLGKERTTYAKFAVHVRDNSSMYRKELQDLGFKIG